MFPWKSCRRLRRKRQECTVEKGGWVWPLCAVLAQRDKYIMNSGRHWGIRVLEGSHSKGRWPCPPGPLLAAVPERHGLDCRFLLPTH